MITSPRPICPEGVEHGTSVWLGDRMRRTLGDAVGWVIRRGPASGCGHTAQALAVVVLAKTNAADGRWSTTSVPDLAGWLGVTDDTIDKALARLRRAGALETRPRYEHGALVGVHCRLLVPDPHPAHPLARLHRVELATLLRACEALFGPGWAPADCPPTPPGMLAGVRGRGAPVARLALLLVLLAVRDDGRLRLVGGKVPRGYGRADVTVGRLLGAGPSVGKRALAVLVGAGVLVKSSPPTSTGMDGCTVVVFPAAVAGRGRPLPAPSGPRIPAQSGTAERWPRPTVPEDVQVTGREEVDGPGIRAQSGTAETHAVHAVVVPPGGPPEVSCGDPAEGGEGLAAVGGSARAHALRAEDSQQLTRAIPAVVRDAVPGLFERMTPGQRGVAARDVAAVLGMWSWDARKLAGHLAQRFAPMTLTDPEAGRGYIGAGDSPFRWLRANLPVRAETPRQERERLAQDGDQARVAVAALAARLESERRVPAARCSTDAAAKRAADRAEAREHVRAASEARRSAEGHTGAALRAWVLHDLAVWDAKYPVTCGR